MAKVDYVRFSITFAFFTLITIESSGGLGHKNFECERNKCTCRIFPINGYGYDISPLENITTGYLTYSNNELVYLFHPCSNFKFPFKKETACSTGCSLCVFHATIPAKEKLTIDAVLAGDISGNYTVLALAEQADFLASESETHLFYRNKEITTNIDLVCDESVDAKSELSLKNPNEQFSNITHNLVLKSPFSCYRKLKEDEHYMSGAAVFFLILLAFAAAYFFGGMLVLRFVKGASGIEMIPNYDFWSSLPDRIKTGCLRIMKKDHGQDSYDRI